MKAARTVRRALEGNVPVFGLVTRPPSTLFFLIHLGLIGDEFKTARKHILALMPGDAAFKRGRRKSKAEDPVAEATEVCCETD